MCGLVLGRCAVHVYKPAKFVSDKYDKPKARFPGKSVDGAALLKFINKKALPLVGQKTWKSTARYEAGGLPVLTLFAAVDLEKNAKGYEYYANRLRRVAVDFADKLLFNIGDKEDFSYLLPDYGLELPEKKDIGVGIKVGSSHYAMAESFSVDNLRAFVEAFRAGGLVAKVKEEPDYSADYGNGGDDEEDDGEPSSVVTLTGDNFKEVVLAEGTDVLVEFYAPWCGHCMQLKPTYKKVAAAFADSPSVTVAAMDATAHDVPAGFDVQGYPTIFFVKVRVGGGATQWEGHFLCCLSSKDCPRRKWPQLGAAHRVCVCVCVLGCLRANRTAVGPRAAHSLLLYFGCVVISLCPGGCQGRAGSLRGRQGR